MILGLFGALQLLLALRVIFRFVRTAGGDRIEVSNESRREQVSVILPVLNEAARIQACLECLVAQTEAVKEILVVDGGSTDSTQSMVASIPIKGPTRALGGRQPGSQRLDRQNMGTLPWV